MPAADRCLDEDTAIALLRGNLSAEGLARVDAHIDTCRTCRQLVSRLADDDCPEMAPTEPSSPEDVSARWAPGTLLVGRFELERLIGTGGMGQVYQARDLQRGVRVAIKAVQLDSAPETVRFEREALVLSELSHPSIVRYVAHGDAPDGTPFLAMDWLDGEDLAARLGRGRLGPTDCVELGRRVADALHLAHVAGIVHRDIKPSNIFLRGGRVDDPVVLDFGVARAEQHPRGSQASTRTGALLGTLGYMAPEQARGAKTAGPRADIFSLGCVLYECLTGERAFAGGPAIEVLARILTDPARRPAESVPSIPPALDALVVQMMAKAPEDRPPDCATVAQALAHSLEAGPPPSPRLPSATPEPRTKRTARNALLASGAILAAVVGVLTFRHARAPAGAAAPASPPTPPSTSVLDSALALHPKNARRLTFEEGCEEFPSFLPDSEAVAYDGEVGTNAAIFVKTLDDRPARRITHGVGWDMAPTVSPEGNRIAFLRIADGHAAIFVLEDGGSEPRRVGPGNIRPTWTRDGRAIWTGELKRELDKLDVTTGSNLESLLLPPGAFAPRALEIEGGGVLVSIATDGASVGGIGLYDAARTLKWLLRGDMDEALTLSPDGAHALGVRLRPTGEGELYDIPLRGGPPVPLPAAGVLPHKGLAVSPNGHHMAWSTCSGTSELVRLVGNGNLHPFDRRWEWDETEIREIPHTGSALVLSSRGGTQQLWRFELDKASEPSRVASADLTPAYMSVSYDGAWVAFSCYDRGIHVVPVDGNAPPRAVTPTVHDAGPAFLRRSHDLVYFTWRDDGHPRIMRVSVDGGEPAVLLDEDARLPAPSPVDDRVLYLAGQQTVESVPMVYEIGTGRSTRLSEELGPGSYRMMTFSPDGRLAVVLVTHPEVVVVDVTKRAVVRRIKVDDEIRDASYVRGELVLARRFWRGDVWVADDPFRSAEK